MERLYPRPPRGGGGAIGRPRAPGGSVGLGRRGCPGRPRPDRRDALPFVRHHRDARPGGGGGPASPGGRNPAGRRRAAADRAVCVGDSVLVRRRVGAGEAHIARRSRPGPGRSPAQRRHGGHRVRALSRVPVQDPCLGGRLRCGRAGRGGSVRHRRHDGAALRPGHCSAAWTRPTRCSPRPSRRRSGRTFGAYGPGAAARLPPRRGAGPAPPRRLGT